MSANPNRKVPISQYEMASNFIDMHLSISIVRRGDLILCKQKWVGSSRPAAEKFECCKIDRVNPSTLHRRAAAFFAPDDSHP